MKRGLFLLLAVLCVFAAAVFVPGAAAESAPASLSLEDLATMEADSVFTMEQVLSLLREAYALGFQDRQRAGNGASADSRAMPEFAGGGKPDYVLNTNSHRFHYPECESVGDMNPKNRLDFCGSREDVIATGYVPCKRCKP